MHAIEMDEAPEEFARCWQAAGRHIEIQAQGPLRSWLKANLNPPFLEHLSFRLGNQLFFVRIEDADGKLNVPGSRNGLLAIAEGCNGHPCIMPMQHRVGGWEPQAAGWGLIDERTGASIDPVSLVSDEHIELTDWELHDFAVQIAREQLVKTDKKLMSWQGNPLVDPSIWFVGKNGPEWVVVRAVRKPTLRADPPANWSEIAERCARIGNVGHFASVLVSNAVDGLASSPDATVLPLWRGYQMAAYYEGLTAGPLRSRKKEPQRTEAGASSGKVPHKINKSRIIYAQVAEGHTFLDPGHWFFHEGQWSLCASAGISAQGWELHICFELFDKPLSDLDFWFETLEGAKQFVSEYFECAVVECEPDEFPRPDAL